MNYARLNIIGGWVLFLLSTTVYTLTLEPTMPFWDCGEFIASAYKLEVGHPPGAPLFMLIARLFSAFSAPEQVPYMVNFLSGLCSGATIMFLFWSITHLAKKLAERDGALTNPRIFAVIGSGVIGALAYTFSDTFWFSAVEGEVYAMSSLFTAVVFWAILKWESVADRGGELRWIVLIAYLMGLSIGVHLLNLLAIPAIAFVYYFKNYEVTRKGIIWTSLVSLGLLGLIQTGVIIWFVKFAGSFEKFFVNTLGMPFNSGAIAYALVVIGLITFGLVYSRRKGWIAVNTLILGVTVALIGYTSFATIIVRSQANTPMDENNPENLFALLSYLNREQYGDRPLLFGQYFNTPEDPEKAYVDGAEVWVKSYSVRVDAGSKSKQSLVLSCRHPWEAEQYIAEHPDQKLMIVEEYIESGEKKGSVVNYDKEFCSVFPRMYSSQASHIAEYKNWSNYKGWNEPGKQEKIKAMEKSIRELESEQQQINAYLSRGRDKITPEQANQLESRYRSNERALTKKYGEAIPSKGEDIRYLMSYQVDWMYWRYFMWNFAGRQDDQQGHGDFLDGNWISGISMIDEARLGNQKELPEIERNNKGRNMYFFLPLVLGLIGLVFQSVRHTKDFSVVMMLFLLTGLAIVVYLNQTPLQPRERDYAYAGSFYAFTIWIGLSVYALYYAATKMSWKQLGMASAMGVGGAVFVLLMESLAGGQGTMGASLLAITLIAAILLAIAVAAGSVKGEASWKALLAVVLCLPAPTLMAYYNWDDHNRDGRRTGVDMANNYLNSLQQDAIIFTNGDNDTFPLWYAQEVEGIRTDVRVVNLSLLNTDWYIDQMKRRAYESAPVPFSIKEQKYRQGTRDVLFLDPYGEEPGPMDLRKALEFCTKDDAPTVPNGDKNMHYLPTHRFTLKLDSAAVQQYAQFLHEGDSLVTTLEFELTDDRGRPRNYITKAQLMVLDLLANMDWTRPVYFAVTTGGEAYMGLERYFQLEGLAYRMTPILHAKSPNPNLDGGVATDLMYENMMSRFKWGNMDTRPIYMDENNRRMTTNLRLQFSHLAEQLIEEGKLDSAKAVLNKALDVMPEYNVPYEQAQVMWHMTELLYEAGDTDRALQLTKRLVELNNQEVDFYQSIDPSMRAPLERDIMIRLQISDRLVAQAKKYFPDDAEVKAMDEANERVQQSFGAEVEEEEAPPMRTIPGVEIGGPEGIQYKDSAKKDS